MRYLVTGGAGFVGSHLAEALLDRGHEVHVYDDLSTGKLSNVESLYEDERFTSTVGDVRDVEKLEPVLMGCDGVFHLAAPALRDRFREYPVEILQEGLHGTETVLELSERHGKKVLITTSPLVYGSVEEDVRPDRGLRESDGIRIGPPQEAQWSRSYLEGFEESMAGAYHRARHLPVVVVRLFNVVGPRQTRGPGRVLPGLIERALLGRSLELPENGSTTVCLCYVGDAVRGLRRLLDTADADGGTYNVGSTIRTSLRDLAETVREVTGSPSEIQTRYDRAVSDPFPKLLNRVPNLEAVREVIGYEPTYSIEEMIIEMITEQPAPWTLFEPDEG